jgi:DNA-binding NtrC family response regulator
MKTEYAPATVGDETEAKADKVDGNGDHPRIEITGLPEGLPLKEATRLAARLVERELILKALSRTRWNRKRAAQELQISYKALLYKLKLINSNGYTAT